MNPLCVLRAVLALACLTPLANPALAQEPVFTETFDDPTLPGWEHPPEVVVVDGVLRVPGSGFAFHGGTWADMTLSIRARYTGEGDLLIHYRWSEDANYAVHISRQLVTLERIELGSVTHLGEGAAALPLGEWVELTVTVDDGFHHVMVNDSPVLIAEDPYPLPEGGIGLAVQGEVAGEFDNVEVSAGEQVPPPAEPSPAAEATEVPTLEPTTTTLGAEPTPATGGGLCPGAAAFPLALLGLLCLSGRRR